MRRASFAVRSASVLSLLALNQSASAGGVWRWNNPQPQGNPLYGVSFGDSLHGTAVGALGTILHTTNGGLSWAFQPSGTSNDLHGVAFVNDNTGHVVGAGGVLLRTTDGGTTWVPEASGTTEDLWSVSFLNASTGMVVGGNGVALRTNNGGANWISHIADSGGLLYNVVMVNANLALCLDNVVYWMPPFLLRSTDAGQSWTRGYAGFGNDVMAFNGQVGFWAGYGGGAFLTTDGGATWEDRSQWETGVFFQNPTAVAMPSPGRIVLAADNGVIVSTDTGATWTVSTILVGALHWGRCLAFPTPTSGALVGDAGMMFGTLDGGGAWVSETFGDSLDYYGVSFRDRNVGLVCGIGLRVLRTDDQGLDWNPVFDGQGGPYAGLSRMRFTDSMTAYAVGGAWDTRDWSVHGQLIRTTDAGISWSDLSADLPASCYLGEFAATSPRTLTVVGYRMVRSDTFAFQYFAMVGHSTDGGGSWTTFIDSSFVMADGIAFATPSTGVVVGSQGSMLRTTDGGTTWRHVGDVDTNEYYTVRFFNARTGIIVGTSGTMLRTTDAGLTWRRLPAITDSTVSDVAVSTSGWAVAVAPGTILTSRDTGKTWAALSPTMTHNGLYGVAMADSSEALVVGAAGTILQFQDTTGVGSGGGTGGGGGGGGGGTGPRPAFADDASALLFNTMMVGDRDSQVVHVWNPTADTLTIRSVVSDNPSFSVSPKSAVIAGHDTVPFTITYLPVAGGTQLGRVIFLHNGLSRRDVVVARGLARSRSLTWSPWVVGCDSVAVDSSTATTFDVHNASDSDVTITGVNSTDAQFTTDAQPLRLLAGESTTITVTFAPRRAGLSTAKLAIENSGFPAADSVSVYGVGTAAACTLSTAVLDYGDVPLRLVREDSVAVFNGGNRALVVSSIVTTSAHFTVDADNMTVPAGGTGVVHVRFHAIDSVPQNAWLMLHHNAGAGVDSVALNGRGVYRDVALDPVTLNFGTVPPNATRADSFRVYNRSSYVLSVSNVSTTDPHFTVTPSGRNVAQGDSATFVVTFQPDNAGQYAGLVLVRHNMGGGVDTVRVFGNSATGVVEGAVAPLIASLAQNYPNPFARTTAIPYVLDRDADVSLRIFTVMGSLVADIESGMRHAGVHRVAWRADALPPGVYVCRLRVRAGARTAVASRMVLLSR